MEKLDYIQKLEKELLQRTEALAQKEKAVAELKLNLEKVIEDKTAELRLANEKLSLLASTDPLTELMNRREFENRFHQEVERSQRYKRVFAIAMVDVDGFKRINDSQGHAFGDRILKLLAKIFAINLRKTDIVARIGGDEFVLLLPETPTEKAVEICNRLKTVIEEAFRHDGQITASFGLAAFPNAGNDATKILEFADQALYEAKQAGRNRVKLKEKTQYGSLFHTK